MRLAGLDDKDQAIFPAPPPRGPAIVARLPFNLVEPAAITTRGFDMRSLKEAMLLAGLKSACPLRQCHTDSQPVARISLINQLILCIILVSWTLSEGWAVYHLGNISAEPWRHERTG